MNGESQTHDQDVLRNTWHLGKRNMTRCENGTVQKVAVGCIPKCGMTDQRIAICRHESRTSYSPLMHRAPFPSRQSSSFTIGKTRSAVCLFTVGYWDKAGCYDAAFGVTGKRSGTLLTVAEVSSTSVSSSTKVGGSSHVPTDV